MLSKFFRQFLVGFLNGWNAILGLVSCVIQRELDKGPFVAYVLRSSLRTRLKERLLLTDLIHQRIRDRQQELCSSYGVQLKHRGLGPSALQCGYLGKVVDQIVYLLRRCQNLGAASSNPVQTRQDTIDVDCCVLGNTRREEKVNEGYTSLIFPPYLLVIIGYI